MNLQIPMTKNESKVAEIECRFEGNLINWYTAEDTLAADEPLEIAGKFTKADLLTLAEVCFSKIA